MVHRIGVEMGDTATSLLMLVLGLFVAFALGRSIISVVRVAHTPASKRRKLPLVWVLGTGLLAGLGIAILIVGYLHTNVLYLLAGAYLLFTAVHYYGVRRMP